MNVALMLRIFASCKTEVKVVVISLVVIIMMPAFAVVVIAQSGISAVADTLATLNPTTHLVEVRNPSGVIIAQLNATTVWPTTGYISQEFGVNHLPWQVAHTGIDIASPQRKVGDPITPFMVGTVTKTIDSTKGHGKHVIIDHGNNITAVYGHMSAIKAVEGQAVKPGDIVGLMGSTGTSTGPHLHFEVRVFGVPVNPRTFTVGNPMREGS